MSFHKPDCEKQVAVFVDGAHLLYTISVLKNDIDPVHLLHCLTANKQLRQAYFYAISHQKNSQLTAYLGQIAAGGYTLHTREVDKELLGQNRIDFSDRMLSDILLHLPYVDSIILVSCNARLANIREYADLRDVDIKLVSLTSRTDPSLIESADQHIDLLEFSRSDAAASTHQGSSACLEHIPSVELGQIA